LNSIYSNHLFQVLKPVLPLIFNVKPNVEFYFIPFIFHITHCLSSNCFAMAVISKLLALLMICAHPTLNSIANFTLISSFAPFHLLVCVYFSFRIPFLLSLYQIFQTYADLLVSSLIRISTKQRYFPIAYSVIRSFVAP